MSWHINYIFAKTLSEYRYPDINSIVEQDNFDKKTDYISLTSRSNFLGEELKLHFEFLEKYYPNIQFLMDYGLFNSTLDVEIDDYRQIFDRERQKLVVQDFNDFFKAVLLNNAQTSYGDIFGSTGDLIKEINDKDFDELIKSIDYDAESPYDFYGCLEIMNRFFKISLAENKTIIGYVYY